MVGGNEQQIVLSKQIQQGGECRVEFPQRTIEPRNVVPVPKILVEIYQVGEK